MVRREQSAAVQLEMMSADPPVHHGSAADKAIMGSKAPHIL
jgi:hypothetical protein